MLDGAGIFTSTVGKGAGAKIRIGPVQVGLASVGDHAGLRGGRFYKYDRYVLGGDMCFAVAGIEDFTCMGKEVGTRRKEFTIIYCVVPLPIQVVDISVNCLYYVRQEV